MNRIRRYFTPDERRLSLSALALAAALGVVLTAQPTTFDVLITGGRIVDGTGAPWFEGDVGIVGDRIQAVGKLPNAMARTKIDAAGLVVSPGFIDTQGQSEFTVLVDNRVASKITQGITTEITGEGASIAPVNDRLIAQSAAAYKAYGITRDWRTLDEYLRRLERSKSTINMGTFVGAGGLRNYVIGLDDRPATASELDQMRGLVAQAMEDGAMGLSTSLQYVPHRFASTAEIVELAKVASRYGGVYFTHQRSEGNRIFESLDEVFAIADQAKIPTVVWHLKAVYPQNFGKIGEVLRRIEDARSRGLNISGAVYPYARGSNELTACLPTWAWEGGPDKMIARLSDPAQREKIKKEMDDPNVSWENQWQGSGGSDGVTLATVLNPDLKKYEGLSFTEIGRQINKDPRDAAMDIAIQDRGYSQVVIAAMNEDDMRVVNIHRLVSLGVDSEGRAEDGPLSHTKVHPRSFGAFPRYLAMYVRDQHAIALEEAIRKMTSLAAAQVGIRDRGIIRPGMMADITVFDMNRVQDKATYVDPMHYSVGVMDVLVNGKAVVRDGKITDERPGRPLRGPGYRPRPAAN